jgi:hypothetical protein
VTARWVVVDVAGIQHGSPHLSEQDALMSKIELILGSDEETDNRYRVVQQAGMPAHANH